MELALDTLSHSAERRESVEAQAISAVFLP